MALRLGGTYLLAGAALHSQSRASYHLSRMEMTASDAIALGAASDAELGSSIVLEGESSVDAEVGLTYQSEAVELEYDAGREFLSSEVERATGRGYEYEAEETRERGGGDASASSAHFAESGRAKLEYATLRARGEVEGERAIADSGASAASWSGSAEATEVANVAGGEAIEYGAVAASDVASGLEDGEVVVEAESGAAEDAGAMAACAPVPVLNLVCEAIGSVVEIGYQSVAAFEGAKAAVEGISAATARGKERAELALAVEKREEASRLAMEAERLQVKADEEGAMAAADETRAEAMRVEAGEEEALGEELLEESEREEALAVVLDEKASEQYVMAARDESIAVEEESSAIASQLESEELMSKSASEEFESLAERTDAMSKNAEADGLLKQSVRYGIRSLGFVIHSIVTAGLVTYVVLMKGFLKTVAPGVGRLWNGEHRLSAVHIHEGICDFLIHLGILIGTIASMPNQLIKFEGISAPLRIRALFYFAVVAGVIESIAKAVVAGSAIVFFSQLVHLVPVCMMELLIVMVLFGQGVFDEINLVHMQPVLIWGILLLLKCISSWVVKSIAENTKHKQHRRHIDEGECDFLHAKDRRSKEMCSPADVNMEYGSMEDGSILHENGDISNKKYNSSSTFLERCRKTLFDYCGGLRLSSDLLVLSLMVAILRHCWPLLKVLHPVAMTFLGTITAWVSLPALIAATVVLVVIVHFLFVH